MGQKQCRTYGRCEVCGKVGSCFDVASKLIPARNWIVLIVWRATRKIVGR